MKAVRREDTTFGLSDVPVPTPARDEALVKITTAGVCHSDVHIARGDWGTTSGPAALGHEAIGIVESIGEGADRWVSPGDRVILGLGGAGGVWCGTCQYCLAGLPRHCSVTKGIIGTYAEYMAVWAPSLVKLPDGIADLEAPLACGGLTAYGAVKKLLTHGVYPGEWIAIVGAAGGLGHYAVQIANAFGYRVVGVDIGEARLDFVRSLGAELAVGAADAREVVAAETGGVSASLVFSAAMAGFPLGLDLLRPAGLFVAVGIPPASEGKIELDPLTFFRRDPTLIYSAVGTVQEMRELVELAARGKVASHVSRTGALSELDQILDELRDGKYLGRAVITDLAG